MTKLNQGTKTVQKRGEQSLLFVPCAVALGFSSLGIRCERTVQTIL